MNTPGLTGEHHKLVPPFRRPVGRRDVPGRAGGTAPALKCIDNSRLGEPRLSDQPGFCPVAGGVDFGSKVHTSKVTNTVTASRDLYREPGEEFVYPDQMPTKSRDPWLQRQHFRTLVDAWMETNQKSKRDFASECDIAAESLKQYYSGKHVPGRDLALRFSKILRVDLTELLGNPGADNSKEDPDARSFADTMYFLGKDMSPEEMKIVVEMVKQGKALAEARRERESKDKKA